MIEWYLIPAVVTAIIALVTTHMKEWQEEYNKGGKFAQWQLIVASLWSGITWPWFWFQFFLYRKNQ